MSDATPENPTGIPLSADVWDDAKTLDVAVFPVCDQLQRQPVIRGKERRWQSENAEFIAAYNAGVENDGLPLDAWRSF